MAAAADPSSHPLNGKPVLRNPSRPASNNSNRQHKDMVLAQQTRARTHGTTPTILFRQTEKLKHLIFNINKIIYIARRKRVQ